MLLTRDVPKSYGYGRDRRGGSKGERAAQTLREEGPRQRNIRQNRPWGSHIISNNVDSSQW